MFWELCREEKGPGFLLSEGRKHVAEMDLCYSKEGFCADCIYEAMMFLTPRYLYLFTVRVSFDVIT